MLTVVPELSTAYTSKMSRSAAETAIPSKFQWHSIVLALIEVQDAVAVLVPSTSSGRASPAEYLHKRAIQRVPLASLAGVCKAILLSL